MTLPAWPSGVPVNVVEGTLQITQTAAAPLVSEMNSGTTRRRRVQTLRIGRVAFATLMTTAQVAAFKSFYEDTLSTGAARFTRPILFNGAALTRNCAFVDPPPAYVPVGPGRMRVAMSLLVENL